MNSIIVGEAKMVKRKKRKHLKLIPCFFLLLLIGSIIYFGVTYFQKKENQLIIFNRNQKIMEEKNKKDQEEAYNNCLNRKYEENELTELLMTKKQEIDTYIINNHYNISVYYEDLTTGFDYSYKPSTIYYGASLIKLVDALYLINKAIAGEINLDTETIIYTANYKKAFSSGMESHSFGDKISLRDLITYAISVSDNSAHMMLIDYIGFNNLKAYGESLGAKVILSGGDNFGSQTAEDTNIYLKEAYRIITESEEYGSFLKKIMDNNERNAFNTKTIKIYHKYGSYADNYHDIGLSLGEKPYTISILTLHENSGYKQIIQEVHNKIIELKDVFYENRKSICQTEIYKK